MLDHFYEIFQKIQKCDYFFQKMSLNMTLVSQTSLVKVRVITCNYVYVLVNTIIIYIIILLNNEELFNIE